MRSGVTQTEFNYDSSFALRRLGVAALGIGVGWFSLATDLLESNSNLIQSMGPPLMWFLIVSSASGVVMSVRALGTRGLVDERGLKFHGTVRSSLVRWADVHSVAWREEDLLVLEVQAFPKRRRIDLRWFDDPASWKRAIQEQWAGQATS